MKTEIIRKAALELNAVDSNNVVKVAGIAKTIVNWVKGWGDPEFQQKLRELNEISPEIKSLVDNLSVSMEELNKALSNTDPEAFGKALEEVKPMASELATKLDKAERMSDDLKSRAPVEGVVDENGNVYTGDEVGKLERGWYKDPELKKTIISLLPDDLDVPVRRGINQPLSDFEHFQKFTADDVRFSDKAKEWAVEGIINAATNSAALSASEYAMLVDYVESNKENIISDLREKIIGGILKNYHFPAQGHFKMKAVVDAGTIKIPGLNFSVRFPIVILDDKLASLQGVKELDVASLRGISSASKIDRKELVIQEDLLKSILESNNWNISHTAKEFGVSRHVIRKRMEELGLQRPQREIPSLQQPIKQEPVQEPQAQVPQFQPEQEVVDVTEDAEEVDSVEEPDKDEELRTQTSRLDELKKMAATGSTDRHEWARGVIQRAFPTVMGRQPTESEIQAVQAVAHLESSYGSGWKGAGRGSNNWGAIQCGSSCKVNGRCDPSVSFEHRDSTPQPDGTNKWYVTCFKKYPTPEAGAADLIKTLFLSERKSVKGTDKTKTRGELLQEAVARGDLRAFSEAMYDTVYYEGTGKDKETRVSRHMGALNRALKDMTKSSNRQIAMIDGGSSSPASVLPAQTSPYTGDDAKALFDFLYASGPIEKIVKRALYEKHLPKTRVLISVGSKNLEFYNRVRFAKVLSSALRVELDAECSIHNYNDKIEIEADIYGSEEAVVKAATALYQGISETFEFSTDSRVKASLVAGARSSYGLIESSTMESCFRKFAFAQGAKRVK